MRRAMLVLALGLAFAYCALPQESQSPAATEAGDPWIVWKWINFAILAAGLGYLISKHAPAYFRSRSDDIQKALVQAAQELKDAEARAATLETRLMGIQNEIQSLRTTARAEMAAEGERIFRDTERNLQRVQNQAAQEIALMTRASRDELRKYSASLALDLAEQRIRSRITPDAQNGLADGFLYDLRQRVRPGVTA